MSEQAEHGHDGQQKTQTNEEKAFLKAQGHGLDIHLLTDGPQRLLFYGRFGHASVVQGQA